MPLDRSSDDLQAAGAAVVENSPFCTICNLAIQNPSVLSETVCRHTFHKICISSYIKTHSDCPACGSKIIKDAKQVNSSATQKVGSSITTRSTSKARIFDANRTDESLRRESGSNPSAGSSSSQPTLTMENVKDIVTSIVSDQQAQLVQSLSGQISSLVERSVEASLTRLNINPASQNVDASSPVRTNNVAMPNVSDVEQRTLEQLLGLPSSNNERSNNGYGQINLDGNSLNRSRLSNPSSFSDLASRPDKVSQIIANWKLKFNGSSSSLPVDNFIYRVEALTKQTLNGDFETLCRSASALFDGKASDWFWRFHRSVHVVQWFDLCKALRQQYRDSRTDIDFRELIRDRKQKPNEPFDVFYEAVIDLVDRLDKPLEDKILVEILRRNLLPDIQHEILNMTIASVGQLREICRRREFFLQDLSRRHTFANTRSNNFSRRVAEVNVNSPTDPELLEYEEVSELATICWNCRKSGHRYQECLAERSVFCYGCGTPQVYKPNCSTCNTNSKNFQSSAPRGALRPKTCQQSSQTM